MTEPEVNPFASRFVRPGAVTFRFLDEHTSVPHLWETIRRSRVVQIVGPHGSGKTTLLHQLVSERPDWVQPRAWLQLVRDPEETRLQRIVTRAKDTWAVCRAAGKLPAGQMLVVDGAEQIPAPVRFLMLLGARVFRRSLVITSHHPLPGVHVLYRTEVTPELIRALLEEKISQRHAARVESYLQTVELSKIDNVRDLWSQLYEVVSTTTVREATSWQSA